MACILHPSAPRRHPNCARILVQLRRGGDPATNRTTRRRDDKTTGNAPRWLSGRGGRFLVVPSARRLVVLDRRGAPTRSHESRFSLSIPRSREVPAHDDRTGDLPFAPPCRDDHRDLQGLLPRRKRGARTARGERRSRDTRPQPAWREPRRARPPKPPSKEKKIPLDFLEKSSVLNAIHDS